jgi:hypothetical protein
MPNSIGQYTRLSCKERNQVATHNSTYNGISYILRYCTEQQVKTWQVMHYHLLFMLLVPFLDPTSNLKYLFSNIFSLHEDKTANRIYLCRSYTFNFIFTPFLRCRRR